MAKEKIQILIIHGGMTFKNQKDYLNYLKNRPIKIENRIKWNEKYLDNNLGKNVQIIRPRMPLADNAKYSDWKIHFERHFPYLKDNIILIGESLGGTFLARYLSENKFPKKILSVYLVCPPFDNTILGEDLVGGFKLKSELSLIEKQIRHLNLLFSKNDDCVPVSHAKKYADKLKNANIILLDNMNGHFKVAKLPIIIKMIKKDLKNIKK
jgi:predicted alpha/beta hydrolase family esterase